MIKFTFDDNNATKKFVLGIFGKDIDHDDYIVEKKDEKRILGFDGQEMTIQDFGGIKSGSEIYARSDIVSLVEFYEKYLASSM